eukprot:scaffold1398_cov116-Cylindrotheca_fusiformis.AAC.31
MKFECFPQFHEDIAKHILSFVAEGPLERTSPEGNSIVQSPLTHILPLVNKMFHEWSSLDVYWEACLKRQLNRKDKSRCHWIGGFRRLLPIDFRVEKDSDLLDAVLEHIGEITYKDLYKKMFTSQIRCDYPVFIMPCQLQLGHVYGLRLFEPSRYRIMISELIESCGKPEQACQGEPIELAVRNGVLQSLSLFHASLGTKLGPGELAWVVDVVYCRTHENGTADVELVPTCLVGLDKVWVRPSSDHLFYAKATRM